MPRSEDILAAAEAPACERTKVEARVRVELTMVDLQTTALPFGYRAN